MASHYSLKKGVEIFSKPSSKATTVELSKIHTMGTYEPMDSKNLTKNQKQQALNSLLFITEKRDGRIKARKVAIGSKQRSFDGYNKANGSSPTVSTKGVILTAAIDGHFCRNVATINIPNAFLWANNEGEVIMKLRGKWLNYLWPSTQASIGSTLSWEKMANPFCMLNCSKPFMGFSNLPSFSTENYKNNLKQ